MALRSLSRGPRAALGLACAALVAGAAIAVSPAWAEFEVKAPDGRTLLIKDNGTWTVVAAAPAASAASAPAAPASAASAPAVYEGPFSELRIVRRQATTTACTFSMVLANKFKYEIRSFVPEFVVERKDGVAYTEQSLSFHFIRPGDERRAELQLLGVQCDDIGRLVVQRGDRCEMGELHRFMESDGQCLGRIKLLPTDLVKFEKVQPPAPAASGPAAGASAPAAAASTAAGGK